TWRCRLVIAIMANYLRMKGELSIEKFVQPGNHLDVTDLINPRLVRSTDRQVARKWNSREYGIPPPAARPRYCSRSQPYSRGRPPRRCESPFPGSRPAARYNAERDLQEKGFPALQAAGEQAHVLWAAYEGRGRRQGCARDLGLLVRAFPAKHTAAIPGDAERTKLSETPGSRHARTRPSSAPVVRHRQSRGQDDSSSSGTPSASLVRQACSFPAYRFYAAFIVQD